MPGIDRTARPSTEKKAKSLLLIRCALPPEQQSLAAFARFLKEAGYPVSLGTLKDYSRRFGWQKQLEELNRRSLVRHDHERLAHAARTNETYAKLGRALSGVGSRALQSLLASPERIDQMKPAEITRVIEVGIRTESQALAVERDRADVAESMLNELVPRVVEAFKQLNDDPDPRSRGRAFASAFDSIADEWLKQFSDGGNLK